MARAWAFLRIVFGRHELKPSSQAVETKKGNIMQKLAGSWKAIVALVGSFVVTQLPDIEVFVQGWVQSAVSAVFVAAAVWLKANATS